MKFLNKLKNKNKKEGDVKIENKPNYSNIIGKYEIINANAHIDVVHDACKICYNKSHEESIEAKMKYIAGKVKVGHESILEHSNVIMKYNIPNDRMEELAEVLKSCKYLYPKFKIIENEICLVIAGSFRGFKYLIRDMATCKTNSIFCSILDSMYNFNSCYFEDLIKDNIMNRNKFLDLDDYTVNFDYENYNDVANILYIDDVKKISEKLNMFDMYDILDLTVVNILFKDVSRIISQQLTRHRVGITQLSQRYVDYSKDEFKFNSPAKFTDKYSEDKKYEIEFNSNKYKFTLQELGDELMELYPQLTEQGLKKEDSRAYLPNNATTSLYMTFTIKNLIHFLYLRTSLGAQNEIRLIAEDIESKIINELEPIIGDIYQYNEPRYKYDLLQIKKNFDETIDEVISTEEL